MVLTVIILDNPDVPVLALETYRAFVSSRLFLKVSLAHFVHILRLAVEGRPGIVRDKVVYVGR